MQFQKYINHNTSRSIQPAQQQTFKKLSSTIPNSNINNNKPRVIKFVGNMQQNIKQILHGINCHCGNKKQFYNIMVVFANKIEKLRKQREHYKNTLKEYLMTMNGRNTNERVESMVKKDVQVQTVHVVGQKIRQPLSQIKSLSNSTNQNNLQNSSNSKKRTQNKKQNERQQQQRVKYQSSLNLKKNYKNKQNQQHRNNYTAIKKSSQQHNQNSQYTTTPLKQIKSQDKRKRRFYQDDIAGDISNNRCQEVQNSHSKQKHSNFIPKGSSHSSSNRKKIMLSQENKNHNNNMILNELQEFSLNFSSFEDGEKGFSNNIGNQRQCSEFMKQVSGIMSETNLLESDEEDEIRQLNAKQQQQSRSSRKSSAKKSRQSLQSSLSRNKKSQSILDNITPNTKGLSQLQQKINKLKMLKQSTNLIHFGQTIGRQFNESILSDKMKVYETQNTLDSNVFSSNANVKKFGNTNNFKDLLLDGQQMTKKKSLTAIKSKVSRESQKKDEERQKQNHFQKKPYQRTSHKAQSIHKQNKQNQRKTQVETCLKHYNISLEKLQEFIQNKNCIKQLQRTQDFENNLRGFKTFTSCTLKQPPASYDKYDMTGGNTSNIFQYISFKEDGNNNGKNKNSIKVLGQRNINY